MRGLRLAEAAQRPGAVVFQDGSGTRSWNLLTPAVRRTLFRSTPQGLEPLQLWLNENGLPRDPHGWHGTFATANARVRQLGLTDFTVTAHMLRHSFALRWFAVGKLASASRLERLSEEEARDFRAQFGDTWHLVQTMLGHRRVETTKNVYPSASSMWSCCSSTPTGSRSAPSWPKRSPPTRESAPTRCLLTVSLRGRKASLPGTGSATTDHGLLGDSGLVVRRYSQDGSQRRDFSFAELPAPEAIRRTLAQAFARRTAPATKLTSITSMGLVFLAARRFTFYLAQLTEPPATVSGLTRGHIDGFRAWRSPQTRWAEAEVRQIEMLLRLADGLNEELLARCCQPSPPQTRPELNKKASYSRDEFKRIADAARADLRAAAERIRANRTDLARYRAGELSDPDRRLQLMDFIDRHGDLPRYAAGNETSTRGLVKHWTSKFGTVNEIASWTNLTSVEAIAGAILLGVMTGQNQSVLLGTPAAHHRADGYTGTPATAIVDAVKPRRGRRAHMTVALSEVPDWISMPAEPEAISARDQLHTPFGVYALLHELTAPARAATGSGRLFTAWAGKGGARQPYGLRPLTGSLAWFYADRWSRRHHLCPGSADSGAGEPLRVTLSRIRLTYAELHQQPVAHTEQALASTYLTRNRGNLGEYQQVVAAALAEEVSKARVRGVIAQLTSADLAEARTSPEAVARRGGIDAVTLKRMIAGELDTVMNACTANESSPHAPAGQPCRASFMQCLSCPCARTLPRHVPVQVLVRDQLDVRRAELTPLAWTQRYALPHAQLTHLLGQHDETGLDDARAAITDADRAVVARFLNRELDLR